MYHRRNHTLVLVDLLDNVADRTLGTNELPRVYFRWPGM